jgi:hypothetical protein
MCRVGKTNPGGITLISSHEPVAITEAKKRPQYCGLSLTAPGPPGVRDIILNFTPLCQEPF